MFDLYFRHSLHCAIREKAGDKLFDVYRENGQNMIATHTQCTEWQANAGMLYVWAGLYFLLLAGLAICSSMDEERIKRGERVTHTGAEFTSTAAFTGVFMTLLAAEAGLLVIANWGPILKIVGGAGIVLGWYFGIKLFMRHRKRMVIALQRGFTALSVTARLLRRVARQEREMAAVERRFREAWGIPEEAVPPERPPVSRGPR
jgi:hypothetical protein